MLTRWFVTLVTWAVGRRLHNYWFHTGRGWCRVDALAANRVMSRVAPEIYDLLADLAIEQNQCLAPGGGGVEQFVGSVFFTRFVTAVRRVFATNPETDLSALTDQEVYLVFDGFARRVGKLCRHLERKKTTNN